MLPDQLAGALDLAVSAATAPRGRILAAFRSPELRAYDLREPRSGERAGGAGGILMPRTAETR